MNEPAIARAKQLIVDCELGPNCNICQTLRDLLAALSPQGATTTEQTHTPNCNVWRGVSAHPESESLPCDCGAATDTFIIQREGVNWINEDFVLLQAQIAALEARLATTEQERAMNRLEAAEARVASPASRQRAAFKAGWKAGEARLHFNDGPGEYAPTFEDAIEAYTAALAAPVEQEETP